MAASGTAKAGATRWTPATGTAAHSRTHGRSVAERPTLPDGDGQAESDGGQAFCSKLVCECYPERFIAVLPDGRTRLDSVRFCEAEFRPQDGQG
jgi:hypothetical protein